MKVGKTTGKYRLADVSFVVAGDVLSSTQPIQELQQEVLYDDGSIEWVSLPTAKVTCIYDGDNVTVRERAE